MTLFIRPGCGFSTMNIFKWFDNDTHELMNERSSCSSAFLCHTPSLTFFCASHMQMLYCNCRAKGDELD